MEIRTWCLVLVVLVAACAAPAPPAAPAPQAAGDGHPAEAPRSTGPKRLVAAIQSDPGLLNSWVNPPGAGVPGLDTLESLIAAGLSVADEQTQLRPLLAEAVPTVENGGWRVFPDGRMETRWTLRAGATWHDGTPFTTDDLAFTARVEQDKALDIRYKNAHDAVDTIATPDARTIVVTWHRPFIYADQLFDTPPFPRHLLEKAYLEDKATLGQLPYWTTGFVGTGPFRVKQFVAGSHALLEANDRYVLGRPRLDELEVKFIPDPNTLSANILAGAVELTLGRSLSLEQAVQVRDQWREGRMDVALSGWIVVFPQFMNPTPAIMGDLRFRRALLHAIDRQQMADSLMDGLVPVAHTFLNPNHPTYQAVAPRIVRYDFDTRRSLELLQELGYMRAGDGSIRDAAGQRVPLEIRASAGRDLNGKAIFAIADNLQRVGLAAEALIMPAQRARDREYVQTFPGMILYNQPTDLNSLARHHSSQTPLPENNFVGNNNSRYVSPEFDGLIDRFYATIPPAERAQVLGQIISHMTTNLNMMGMFYNADTGLVANRVLYASGRRGEGVNQAWNAHEWDVK